jgi:hypothetical protein
MIELEPAMIYRLDVTGPVEAADGSAPIHDGSFGR